jgi:hypothetical protein
VISECRGHIAYVCDLHSKIRKSNPGVGSPYIRNVTFLHDATIGIVP